jgi:hypothetical protein
VPSAQPFEKGLQAAPAAIFGAQVAVPPSEAQ